MEGVVNQAVQIAGLVGFTGEFKALGGGEVNDTFLLDCGTNKYILRVTKRQGRDTLLKEANALKFLDMPEAPRLVFFDQNQPIDGHYWIIESYVSGNIQNRLTVAQFNSLGCLLARVHAIKDPEQRSVNLWEHFLYSCRSFGTDQELRNHPNLRLRTLINKAEEAMHQMQPDFNQAPSRLVHGDATPSNILVTGEAVHLIDWEFARFTDPMMEFSTIYYEDMEFNKGKWRIQIQNDEKEALFAGYRSNGGLVDESRIDFWMKMDKLGAATYLFWKLHIVHDGNPDDIEQNTIDLEKLLASLERTL